MEGLYDSIFSREMSLTRELCTTAVVFSGILLLSLAFVRFSSRKKQAGPPSVSFLDTLSVLRHRDRMHIFCMEKAQELGPVFAFNFISRLAVVICGREMIHEAFVKQSVNFANRPYSPIITLLNPLRKGLVNLPYDPIFRKYQQLSLNILKKFGFGKGLMESRIQFEVEDLLANIRKLNGEATSADEFITRGVSNVIISIILSERYDHSSPILSHLNKNVHEFVSNSKDRTILEIFPTLRLLPKYRRCLNGTVKAHDEILEYMGSKIDAALKGELQESYVTHFIEIEGPEFDRDQLLFILRDFIVAGTETTSLSLQSALIFLANNPDIQQRLHKEIDSVVARDRLPSLDDKSMMPFTEAVILELLRLKAPVPLSLPHETMNDTHLNGYFIPKGTLVIPNLYSVNMNPILWKDPSTFNPERFLDADGKVINKESVVSFSMGRRACLGEILARQELFLFLTGMVQHFDIRPPDGQSTVTYEEIVGITIAPTDYKVRLLQRDN